MNDETQARCGRWLAAVGPLLGSVGCLMVRPTRLDSSETVTVVMAWADEAGTPVDYWNRRALEGEPTPEAVASLRQALVRMGYPKKAQSETHMLHVKLVDHPRLGVSTDLAWMAGMWQRWLEPQLSRTLRVLPCPGSRTELVATWERAGGGHRHAFRFLGGVVLPTRETVGELARNLREVAHSHLVDSLALLRPEPLHFEQALEVAALLQAQDARDEDGQPCAVPPAERGSFLQGIVDKLTKGTRSPTMQARVDAFNAQHPAALPPEIEVVAPATNPALEQAYTEVGRAMAEQRRQQAEAQARVGGFVIDDPHPQAAEATGAPGERPMVLRRAVAVALLESPLDMAVCRESGGLNYIPGGTPFVHLDPEASDEGLRLLQVAIEGEQAKRAGGGS